MSKSKSTEKTKRKSYLYIRSDGGLALDAEGFLRDPEVQDLLKRLSEIGKKYHPDARRPPIGALSVGKHRGQ